jgi:hypothetical protein
MQLERRSGGNIDWDKFVELSIPSWTLFLEESDTYFTSRLEESAPLIPPPYNAGIVDFIGKIKHPPEIKHTTLTYIPIAHYLTQIFGSEGNSMAFEMKNSLREILNDLGDEKTLIAIGELSCDPYTIGTVNKVRNSMKKKFRGLGYSAPDLKEWKLDGYELLLSDFLKKRDNFRGVGVDSENVAIFANSHILVDLVKSEELAIELQRRLAFEGRTRHGLNEAFRISSPEEQIIFIQGVGHLLGVRAWCERNNVELNVVVPSPVDEITSRIGF